MRLYELRYPKVPEGFRDGYYHGHNNSEIKSGQMYPSNTPLIFLALHSEDADQYGRFVNYIAVKNGIKSIDLTNSYSQETQQIIDRMQVELRNKRIKSLIFGGKLWRNKPLERKVLGWLIKQGYKKININDESGEDGGETTSVIVVNPDQNCYIIDRV